MKTKHFYSCNHSSNRILGSHSWWYVCTGYNSKKKESYFIAEYIHTVFKDGTSKTRKVIK